MSETAAKHYLDSVVEKTLKNTKARATSGAQVSYFVISKNDIAKGNKVSPTDKDFSESYTEYRKILASILNELRVTNYTDADAAVTAILSKQTNYAVVYLSLRDNDDTLFIFARTYADIGKLQTDIARKMPDDKTFGLVDQRADVSGSPGQKLLAQYLGRYFILKLKTSDKYGIYQVIKVEFKVEVKGKLKSKFKYKVSLKPSLGYYSRFVEKDKLGNFKPPQPLSSQQHGYEVATSNNIIEKTLDGSIVLQTLYLSAQNLGHIEDEAYEQYGTKTIVGEKFSDALALLPISSSEIYLQQIRTILEQAKKKLSAVHSQLGYQFHNYFAKLFNNNPKISFDGKIVSIVALISQLGKGVNSGKLAEGALSPQEQSIQNKAIADIEKILNDVIVNVPGSNTLKQDLFEAINNITVSIISGKPVKKLKPHKKVKGNINLSLKFPKIKLQSVGGSGKSKSSSTKEKTSSTRTAQLRTTTGQFYGLVPLQKLLDATLVQRVKDNMGTGSRRDILNLREGRFARSVKVENLSQSREGMITAFYTYMRPPYDTFSAGGRQEVPKTRDPKLLIAKSIREIGATMVGNRMRAVLI